MWRVDRNKNGKRASQQKNEIETHRVFGGSKTIDKHMAKEKGH